MRTVWKFPIEETVDFSISMPRNSEIRHIDTQRGAPMMWVEVNDEEPVVERRFMIVGTGYKEIPDVGANYVGTFKSVHDVFIFHVYELVTQ